MKKKYFIITVIILTLAILCYLFRDALVKTESISSKEKINSEQPSKEDPVNQIIQEDNEDEAEDEALDENEEDENDLSEKETKMLKMMHEEFAKKDVPITFYGKVIDQDKKPVLGVTISGYASYYKGFLNPQDFENNSDSESHLEKDFSVKTDNNGNFILNGMKGSSIRFNLKKENYSAKKNGYYYSYDPTENSKHTPDPDAPVTFNIWKKGNTERVDRNWLNIGLNKNQESYIEMLPVPREANAKNYDFSIKIVSENIGKPEEEWTLFLESKDGGFVISEDEFMYQAPEKGYKNKIELIISNDKKFPQNDYKLKLYHKGADGTYYSSLTCNIMKFKDGGGSFSFESLVNANNSRNLQVN